MDRPPYQCHQHCTLAKMVGHPYWPGKVKDPAKFLMFSDSQIPNSGLIKFYGSNNFSFVKWEHVLDYETNKKKFPPWKVKKKRTAFKKAVQDCNEALRLKQMNVLDTDEEEEEIEKNNQQQQLIEVKTTTLRFPLEDEPVAAAEQNNKLMNTTSNNPQNQVISLHCRSPNPTNHQTLALVGNELERNFVVDTSQALVPRVKRIGFIGDKEEIARCLLNHGHNVTLWNKNPSKFCKLVENGGKLVGRASDVIDECDVIFSYFHDITEVTNVYMNDGVISSMCEGKGLIEMTTMSCDIIKYYDKMIQSNGGEYMEAPFNENCEYGIFIMAAGNHNLYNKSLTYLQTMATKIEYFGEIGSASAMKLISEMYQGTFLASLKEAMSLVQKCGLDPSMFFQILRASDLTCSLFPQDQQDAVEGNLAANYSRSKQRQQLTNIRMVLQLGDNLNQPLELCSAVKGTYANMFR